MTDGPPTAQMLRRKHVPLRRCVVCRASRPQAELLRFYQDEAGTWHLDLKRRAGGRGAWVCADKPDCQKTKALKRFFRTQAERVGEALTHVMTRYNSRNGGMDAR